MSFSRDVRDEITAIKLYKKDEILSFLSGVFMFSGHVVIKGKNKMYFYISTDSEIIAKKILFLFEKIFLVNLDLYEKNNYNFNKEKIFILEYNKDAEKSKDILKKIFVLKEDDMGTLSFRNDIDKTITKNEHTIKAFFRAAYMMSGTISNPEKSYHLEFISQDLIFSKNVADILNNIGIKTAVTQRKESYIIYIKESESISDFLNLVGAHRTMFKFEDIRIEKQVRNNINRLVNCETANLNKIARTYVRQKKAIQYIFEKKSINFLDDDLRELAILRLQNEEDSLKTLGEKLSVPINKSGVNRRLNKIEKIAQQIYEEEINYAKKRSCGE